MFGRTIALYHLQKSSGAADIIPARHRPAAAEAAPARHDHLGPLLEGGAAALVALTVGFAILWALG